MSYEIGPDFPAMFPEDGPTTTDGKIAELQQLTAFLANTLKAAFERVEAAESLAARQAELLNRMLGVLETQLQNNSLIHERLNRLEGVQE
jgi:hypothetical protein